MISSPLVKYILIAVIFTGSPDKVGLKQMDSFDRLDKCHEPMKAHNDDPPEGTNYSLVCMKIAIK